MYTIGIKKWYNLLKILCAKNIIHQDFYADREKELWEIVLGINDRVIEEKGDIENYLTGILLRIINSREIEFVSAGHPLPIVYSSKSNTADFFTNSEEERYGVIGLNDYPVKYVTETLELESNDEIILYTDGITECMNEDGENYGRARLLESIQAHCKEPVVKDESFTDDITFVILKKK